MRTIEQAPAGFPEHPPPLGWSHTLAVFGAAAAVLFVGTRVLIPHLSRATGLEPVVSWFLVGGLVVFVPLILTGALLLRREHATGDPRLWSRRLRFRRMNRGDWLWGIGALLAIGVLSAGIQRLLMAVLGDVRMHPPFMAFEPLSAGRYWILLAWVPFWLLNIMGEELLWRGVMLPRQEVALGRRAWLANGCGWLLFHVAMGWQLLLVLAPILFILPYVTQRRKNTWVAVLIHAGLNGPGFVAVALGLA